MLNLSLTPPGRRWMTVVPGIRVEVEPLDTARAEAARNEAILRAAALQKEAQASAAAGQPVDATAFTAANAAALVGMAEQFEIEALARFCIVAWEGIGVDGEPAPINPATIEAFARHPDLGPAFRRKLRAALDAVAAEGNASPPSSAGAGGGAGSTAPDAQADQPGTMASPPDAAGAAPAS